MNKKIYIIAFCMISSICLILFVFFAYKKSNHGNNISKSDDNNILNISSYDATVEIEVYSNKNTNKYVLKQQYFAPNIFKQEVLEPENIKGLTTTFDGTNLTIQNKSLSLQTLYEDYNVAQGNSLSLISFIEEYKDNEYAEITETDDEIIIKIELKNRSKYENYKKLYISKNNKLPVKMEIFDINQNRTVYILYREIKINKTSKEDILAKK